MNTTDHTYNHYGETSWKVCLELPQNIYKKNINGYKDYISLTSEYLEMAYANS